MPTIDAVPTLSRSSVQARSAVTCGCCAGQNSSFQCAGAGNAAEQEEAKQEHTEQRLQQDGHTLLQGERFDCCAKFSSGDRNQQTERKRHADCGGGEHANAVGNKPRGNDAGSRQGECADKIQFAGKEFVFHISSLIHCKI